MSSSPSNPWIGRFLGDQQRYRLDQRLGGGGMGDVFLAMDTRVGQYVALKLLKDTLVESTEMRKRFEREIAICVALANEHIVKISDCGVTLESYPFFVMEYLRGETLRQVLLRQKRLSVERAVNIISQICNGLQPAHQGVTLPSGEHIQQVVHRDLKPDNIFLLSTHIGDWVKIVDFGIAKICYEHYEQTHLTRTFLGTFHYAAPEQLQGCENLDNRADIYSLGVMLYEMLSGTDPFGISNTNHISEASWIIAHTSKQPIQLRSQPNCKHLSPELAAVVMRCLEKDPNLRFASVEALDEALQTSLQYKGTDEETTDSPEQPFRTGDTVTKIAPVDPAQLEDIPKLQEETIMQMQSEATEASDTSDIEQLEETIAQQPISAEIDQENLPTIPPNGELPHQPVESLVAIPSSSNFSREAVREKVIAPDYQIRQEATKLSINWLLKFGAVFLIGSVLIGGVYTYFHWQTRKVLEEILSFKQQTNYEQCIAKSEQVSPEATIYTEVESILNECRLRYAKQLASDGNLSEAIKIVKTVSQHSPFYPEAQKELEDWEGF
jgi:eukaryotic-like serine/threonine-protein kinase